ncbi:hypothetical protein DSECCO2_437490 [anaerobic digester metagenome]
MDLPHSHSEGNSINIGFCISHTVFSGFSTSAQIRHPYHTSDNMRMDVYPDRELYFLFSKRQRTSCLSIVVLDEHVGSSGKRIYEGIQGSASHATRHST